jgi:acetyl coenzyme A synthetase (ADP forming)-like protein
MDPPPPAEQRSAQPPSVHYPREREADIILRDGSTLHVRPVREQDTLPIRAFLEAVSTESISFRFFGIPNLDWVTNWAVDVDYRDRYALVAETGAPARIVAHAAYIRTAPERAEVAFLVADELHGHGIATTLLAHLAAVAEQNGITTFTAEVLPSNHRMIEAFRESGFPVDIRRSPESLEIELPTSVTAAARARFEERERVATVAAVRSVLEPRSVAVIGASRTPDTIGYAVLRNILGSDFSGPVYAVNPAAAEVQGLPAHASVTAIGAEVDLAVIVVPAEQVVGVARDCASAGVRTLVVISSGFAETGTAGAERQRELLEICRAAGIRVVGPNCLGVINTDPAVRLNATFATRPPLPGPVGFMSQSGGLGIAIIEAASRLGLGLSSFVAVGNKADLSGNDMLGYWEQDPNTKVALLYLESFGNPRKFARIAPRFSRKKPLLAVKSGRSAAGARATGSHTGTLLEQSDVTVDALFDQAGVIRTDTLHELFAVAQLLTTQPVPRGDRVAVVTNAGGPGIMCADACQADGVDVPELPHVLQAELAAILPEGASVVNPVDMLASCSAEDYGRAVRALIAADACDAVLTIFVPSLTANAVDVARIVREVSEQSPPVAIASVFMTDDAAPLSLRSDTTQVPGYEFPEDAARAVALAARYGRWRSRPVAPAVVLDDTAPEPAVALVADALAAGGGWLLPEHVAALLRCYGLAVVTGAAPADAVELVVGVVNDSNFGPVLACSPGGAAGELGRDVAVRLTPLSALDAHELPRALRTFPLLDGYRGARPCDVASLEQMLLRVSAIVENHPEVVELECDPVHVSPAGTTIAAARVRLELSAPPPTPSLRSY